MYVFVFAWPSAGCVKEGVEKEKTGCRRGRLHPFFTSQQFYYSAKKEKSQPRTFSNEDPALVELLDGVAYRLSLNTATILSEKRCGVNLPHVIQ